MRLASGYELVYGVYTIKEVFFLDRTPRAKVSLKQQIHFTTRRQATTLCWDKYGTHLDAIRAVGGSEVNAAMGLYNLLVLPQEIWPGWGKMKERFDITLTRAMQEEIYARWQALGGMPEISPNLSTRLQLTKWGY